MAVRIRLRRQGKKKQPFYRIVAADSRSPRDGRFLEIIGHYNPLPETEVIEVKRDRLIYWLKEGAQPTETIKNLLKRKGIWEDIIAEVKPPKIRKKTETEPQEATGEDVTEAPEQEA
ncbi:30S ribosomal protein S16 [bacterium]|nr:MAG: 30S ribosomal protein S16 [bacterium]